MPQSPARAPRVPRTQRQVNLHFAATLQNWREVYDRANVFSQIYRERRQKALEFVDRLGLPAAAGVLEIGCGPGLMTADLVRRGLRVQAIDSVAGMVKAASRELADQGLPGAASVRLGDAHELEFPDQTFDLVVLIGVTEWLEDLGRPLSEIARVLKPHGQLVLSADNKWALHLLLDPLRTPLLRPLKKAAKRLVRLFGWRRRSLRLRDYSTRELEGELRKAGLQAVQAVTLGFGPFSLFAQPCLPERLGLRLHGALQRLADRGLPLLRSLGLTHVMTACKAGGPYLREIPGMAELRRKA